MDSVILQGPDALRAAKYMADCLGTEAFDLGPDFGEDTARCYMPPNVRSWVGTVEHWRDGLGWFDAVGKDFLVKFDGPPFCLGNIPSVEGTPL